MTSHIHIHIHIHAITGVIPGELLDSNETEYELIFQVLHSTYPVHRNGEGRGNDVRQKQVKV